MSVIAATHTVYQSSRPRRPFGLGLLPGPAAEREACIWTRSAPWVLDLRLAMRLEGYHAAAQVAAVEYAETRHTVTGLDAVETEDWGMLNAVLARHFPDTHPAEARLAAEPSAADRLAWATGRLSAGRRCDGFRFAPDTPPQRIDDMLFIGACG